MLNRILTRFLQRFLCFFFSFHFSHARKNLCYQGILIDSFVCCNSEACVYRDLEARWHQNKNCIKIRQMCSKCILVQFWSHFLFALRCTPGVQSPERSEERRKKGGKNWTKCLYVRSPVYVLYFFLSNQFIY